MNNIGTLYFNSKHKVLPIDHLYLSLNQDEKRQRAKQIRNVIRREDERLTAEEVTRLKNGYCPKCHMRLPNSGKCDCYM